MLTSKIRTSIITAAAALSIVGVTAIPTAAQAKVAVSNVPVVTLTPTKPVAVKCHVSTSCKLPTPTCSYEGREYKTGEDIEVFTLEDGPEVVEYGVTYDFLVKYEKRACEVGGWKTIETLYWTEGYKNGNPVGRVEEDHAPQG